MVSIFERPVTPMIHADILKDKQARRGAALLVSSQVHPDAEVGEKIAMAEYIINGAAGFVVFNRALNGTNEDGEQTAIQDANGTTIRSVFSSAEAEEPPARD